MSRMNRKRHNGQSTTEYGVVIALIAVIAIAALASASVAVGGAFGFINQRVQAVIPASSVSGSTQTAVVTPSIQSVGQTVTVSGTGYTPDSTVTITLHSTPVVLGTTTSDNSGNAGPVSETIPLSTDTTITHTITLSTPGQTGVSNDLTVTGITMTTAAPFVLSSAAFDAAGNPTVCADSSSPCGFIRPIDPATVAPQSASQFVWSVFDGGVSVDNADLESFINGQPIPVLSLPLGAYIGEHNQGVMTVITSMLGDMAPIRFSIPVVDDAGDFVGWVPFQLTAGQPNGGYGVLWGYFAGSLQTR